MTRSPLLPARRLPHAHPARYSRVRLLAELVVLVVAFVEIGYLLLVWGPAK